MKSGWMSGRRGMDEWNENEQDGWKNGMQEENSSTHRDVIMVAEVLVRMAGNGDEDRK